MVCELSVVDGSSVVHDAIGAKGEQEGEHGKTVSKTETVGVSSKQESSHTTSVLSILSGTGRGDFDRPLKLFPGGAIPP